MYKIYKITNLINNKVYVGYTSKSLQTRFTQHARYKSAKVSLINSAIKKYGIEAFKIEVLEEGTDKEYIQEQREEFWITHYHARDPKCGYNLARGGQGGNTTSNHPNKAVFNKQKSDKLKGNVIYHNPLTKSHIRVKVGENIPTGYIKGRHADWNKALGKAHIGVSPKNKGVSATLEQKEITRRTTRKAMTKLPRKTCVYCGKTLIWFNHDKYHGEKCKFKKTL